MYIVVANFKDEVSPYEYLGFTSFVRLLKNFTLENIKNSKPGRNSDDYEEKNEVKVKKYIKHVSSLLYILTYLL